MNSKIRVGSRHWQPYPALKLRQFTLCGVPEVPSTRGEAMQAEAGGACEHVFRCESGSGPQVFGGEVRLAVRGFY